MTASGMKMHHILNYIDLDFIQGHTYLDHENNKRYIISETVQPMPVKVTVEIAWLKVYIIFSQFDDLALHPRSKLRLKLDKYLTYIIIAISQTVSKVWHSHLVHR